MGNSLHRFTWNLAQPRGTWVRFAVQNIMPIGARDGNAAPKNSKFLLWSISTVVMLFYTPSYSALVFCIWDESLHWLQIYYWETAHQLFTPKFSVQPVGKTMRWIEKWPHIINLLDVLYHHAKFGEDRSTRADRRCENDDEYVKQMYVFVCHAPNPERCAFEGS